MPLLVILSLLIGVNEYDLNLLNSAKDLGVQMTFAIHVYHISLKVNKRSVDVEYQMTFHITHRFIGMLDRLVKPSS